MAGSPLYMPPLKGEVADAVRRLTERFLFRLARTFGKTSPPQSADWGGEAFLRPCGS